MRDVALIQKELSELTGLTQRLGQPDAVPFAPNDSRVIFQLPATAQVIYPTLPPGAPPYWGLTILIIASYDVPGTPNLTKGKVGQTITVWSREPLIKSLEGDKTYQGYVYYAGAEWGAKFWIRDIREAPPDGFMRPFWREHTCPGCNSKLEIEFFPGGPPEMSKDIMCPVCDYDLGVKAINVRIASAEDPRLQNILEQIRILEERLAALRAEIARLKERAGMTPEDEARLAELQRLIDEERAKAGEWTGKVGTLEGEVALWKRRWEAVAALRTGYLTPPEILWQTMEAIMRDPEYIPRLEQMVLHYVDAWGEEAIQEFRELAEAIRQGIREVMETVERRILRIMYLRMFLPKLTEQAELAEENHRALYNQLQDAKAELERIQRRLGDAIAALKRADLEIRRAIALRQAEFEAAMARYELELRTLENLRATYSTLLKEIELARTQAIAEAARQREELLRAKEKDRLAIAEEQTRIAEEFERLAEEATGVERQEYLDKMRTALELAKEAMEAAIASAKEREEIAKEIAAKVAELARMELELEELKRQQAGTEERKEEAEKEVAGLPAIPTWGWAALGIAGATLSAVGIGYALKKKRK